MNVTDLQLPSNRKFGLFFTCFFMLLALYFFQINQRELSSIFGIVCGVFLLTTVVRDNWLLPLNKLWAILGLFLGMITGPIVLGLMFFIVLTPVALVTRLFGRDELRLKKAANSSFWRIHESVDSSVHSFKNQF